VADIVFQVGINDSVSGTWSQKYVGGAQAGEKTTAPDAQ